MHEELFQVYYSNCILPLPEDLALKQDNNKGFAVFHREVHVTEVAPALQREYNSMPILIIIIITGKPSAYTKGCLWVLMMSCPNLTDWFHLTREKQGFAANACQSWLTCLTATGNMVGMMSTSRRNGLLLAHLSGRDWSTQPCTDLLVFLQPAVFAQPH